MRIRTLLPAAALCLATLLPSQAQAGDTPTATARNLQLAIAADAQAQAQYAAFAEQADREGHHQMARLFRAAARSEEVRARRHAEIAGAARRQAGADVAETQVALARELAAVRTTRENLLWALAHENAERATFYPRFIRQARADGDAGATLSFTLAHSTERELVKLYQGALASLDRSRDASEAYHVCATCGHVTRGQPPGECPVSFSGPDAFERID